MLLRKLVVSIAFFSCFSIDSFSQIGVSRDSITLMAAKRNWDTKDSSEIRIHYFGRPVNYYYYFKEGKTNYVLLIANKLDINKVKEYLKQIGFKFISDGKSVNYYYTNDKDKSEALLDYDGKFVVVKIIARKEETPAAAQDSVGMPPKN